MLEGTRSFLRRHVHPVVAWSVFLSIAVLGSIPMMSLAEMPQQTTSSTGQTAPATGSTTMPPPPTGSDVAYSNCIREKCMPASEECKKTEDGTLESHQKCETQTRECISACRASYPAPTNTGTVPPVTTNTLTNPADVCMREKCMPAKELCVKNADGNQEALAKCMQESQTCSTQCRPPMPPTGTPNTQTPTSFNTNAPTTTQPFKIVSGENKPMMLPPGKDATGNQTMGTPSVQPMSEEKQKEMDAKMLAQMQKGMTRFGKQIAAIKLKVSKLEKKGIKVPQVITENVTAAEVLIAQVKAATSIDDLLGVGDDLRDIDETLRDQVPNLDRLANLTRLYANIDLQMKRLGTRLAADKRLAKTSKIDINDLVSHFEQSIVELKGAYADTKAQIASGDIDAGFDALQSEVFDRIADVVQEQAVIDQLLRLTRTITTADREVKNNQLVLNRLKAQKKDITSLQAILDSAKGIVASLKAAAAVKPIDYDGVSDLLSNLEDARAQWTDAVSAAKGIAPSLEINQGVNTNVDLKLPDVSAVTNGTGTETTPSTEAQF